MSITIDIQDQTQVIRVYRDGCYKDKSPYIATATLIYLNKEEVTITSLFGEFCKEAYIQLWDYLYDKGVKTLRFDRGSRQVTRHIIKRENRLD